MKVLLAFKAEPDLNMLAEQAWRDAQSAGLDLTYVRYQGGQDEQAGAEILLRQQPVLSLTALTVGNAHAEPFMRQLSALGFSTLARIVPQEGGDLCFSPQFIAGLLANWITQHPHSLVVTGSQSSEGNNAQTGFWLAEKLGWPVLTGVVDFTVDEANQQVEALLIQDGERLQMRVKLPALLMVTNDGRYSLRVSGIRQKMAASKAEIICTPAPAVNGQANVELTREPQQARRGEKIDGASAQVKAQKLYDTFLRRRLPQ